MAFCLQSEVAAQGMIAGSDATTEAADGLAAKLGTVTLETATFVEAHGGVMAKSAPEAAVSMGGSFFETLTSSDFYKNTKVA